MTRARADHSRVETFASVLRRVGHPPDAADATASKGGSGGLRHVAYRFATLPEGETTPGFANASTWDEALDWIPAPEAPAKPPERPLPGCDEPTVAAELGLTPDLAPGDLRRIRRAFALRNHPDRLHPSRRDNATRRMMTANVLIDRALRAHRRKQAGLQT